MKSLIYPSNGSSTEQAKYAQAITFKWNERLIFQKVFLATLLGMLITLFLSSKSYGQGSCPNDNCTSGDMTITKVELVLANGDPIPSTCSPGQPTLSVKLKVTFDATAQTRYGFLIVGDLYVNNVFAQKIDQCYGEDFSETNTRALDQAF